MTDSDPAARRQRARARRRLWQGRRTTLDRLPEIEVRDGAPAELMALVTELTLTAWALRGTPVPEYTRATMPGRLVRPGAAADG